MTIKVNFSSGSYSAADVVNEFAALFSDGVLNGGLVAAHSPNNLSVDVPDLKAIKAGLFMNNDAIVTVPITSNVSGYGRIDVIAADMDNGTIVAVAGTPSSSPTVPTLTGNKVALANIAVGNNVSVINSGNITDVRSYARSVNIEKADTLHTPTFLNSWYEHNATVFPVRYWKDSLGYVHIKGFIKGGVQGSIVFNLPSGYRPAPGTTIQFSTDSNSAFGEVCIENATGKVQVLIMSTGNWVSLDNCPTFLGY